MDIVVGNGLQIDVVFDVVVDVVVEEEDVPLFLLSTFRRRRRCCHLRRRRWCRHWKACRRFRSNLK